MNKTTCSKGKKILAYFLIIIEAVIQIFGSIYYDQTPELIWSFANAILILVPLAFGIRLGLLCLIPLAVSEIVWSCPGEPCAFNSPGSLLRKH